MGVADNTRRYIKAMNVCHSVTCTIVVAFVLSASHGLFAHADEASFRANLTELANKCDELQLPTQAKITRTW